MMTDVRRSPRPIHVLVVDDSAVVRETLAALLARERDMVVAVASDPIIAMQKMRHQAPDVMILDLELPRMDGLSFLRRLMQDAPMPVVVCSGLTGSGDAALTALFEGAVAVIEKAKLGVRGFLHDAAPSLIETVRGAAGARPMAARQRPGAYPPRPRGAPLGPGSTDAVITAASSSAARVRSETLIALGASTGGTEALRELLEAMPPDAPGLVVVQHMPEAFTGAFAARLNAACSIAVKEAAPNDPILRGRALIAPGNRHIKVRRNGTYFVVDIVDGPPVSGHRPSVDVLFRSVAESAGVNAVGAILTGMGSDGADGLLAMKRAGAATLAQDEASSVVFGMPKEAIARGAANTVLPLRRMAAAVLERASPRWT